jgi:hypothetical protein
MIIKSKSRKDRSFGQLYDYVNRDGKTDAPVLFWNLMSCDAQDRNGIVGEFLDNADFLPERSNGNALYHEIVSLKRTSQHDLETLTQALYELANHYLERRAPDCLAFGRIHVETEHVHCHLMVSANVLQGGRHSISKFRFGAIQVACERYLKAEYPQLIQNFLYGPSRQHRSDRLSNGEFQLERRLGQKPLSDKARVTAQLAAMFAEEITHTTKPLAERLREAGFTLYRNKSGHPGVIKGKKKYRFYRMGLLDAFERVTAEEEAIAARKADLVGYADRTAPVREAMEQDEDFAPRRPLSS